MKLCVNSISRYECILGIFPQLWEGGGGGGNFVSALDQVINGQTGNLHVDNSFNDVSFGKYLNYT